MDMQKELFILLKICYERVCSILEEIGMSIWLLSSVLTTTITRLVFWWLCTKSYIGALQISNWLVRTNESKLIMNWLNSWSYWKSKSNHEITQNRSNPTKDLYGHEASQVEICCGWKSILESVANEGVMRFGRKDKCSPLYIGPYEIIEKIGKVAYELEFPPETSMVHQSSMC